MLECPGKCKGGTFSIVETFQREHKVINNENIEVPVMKDIRKIRCNVCQLVFEEEQPRVLLD